MIIESHGYPESSLWGKLAIITSKLDGGMLVEGFVLGFGYCYNLRRANKECSKSYGTRMSTNKISYIIKYWFKDNYGTRRGALLTHGYRVLSFIGIYRAQRKVNWDEIERLVFVCKGNICRSAYAEAVAKSVGVETISCGIDTRNGKPANDMARKVSSARGFNLEAHKTTMVQSLTFTKADLLIAMEPWQSEYLLENFSAENNCTLLGLWGAPDTPYIHDPYGTSQVYFDHCFNYIENTVYEIARKVK